MKRLMITAETAEIEEMITYIQTHFPKASHKQTPLNLQPDVLALVNDLTQEADKVWEDKGINAENYRQWSLAN